MIYSKLGASFSAVMLLAVTPSWAANGFEINGTKTKLQAEVITSFDEPWAMTFLPDGDALVTTKPGKLFLTTQTGRKIEVGGMWKVAYGGQGGFGDVVLHPDFKENGRVYFSSAETLDGGKTFGAIVTSAKLERSGDEPRLTDIKKIWTQEPKLPGRGHYSHRLAFDKSGMLFITSGDRQKQTPAQDFTKALGKVIRLNDDGSVPKDNPWQDRGDLARSFWTTGHRNLLGIAFDADGRLWAHEMGPRHHASPL